MPHCPSTLMGNVALLQQDAMLAKRDSLQRGGGNRPDAASVGGDIGEPVATAPRDADRRHERQVAVGEGVGEAEPLPVPGCDTRRMYDDTEVRRDEQVTVRRDPQ